MTSTGSWQYGRPRNSMRSLMRQFQIEPIISNWNGKLESLDISSTINDLVWFWIFMKYDISRNFSPMVYLFLHHWHQSMWLQTRYSGSSTFCGAYDEDKTESISIFVLPKKYSHWTSDVLEFLSWHTLKHLTLPFRL